MKYKLSNTKFHTKIVDLLQSARNKVARTVNQTMVTTYFEIGRMIVEEEQGGKERAEYGKQILKELSDVLTKEFGKGFSVTNLKQMRQFYLIYSIGQTPSDDFRNIAQIPSSKSENAISTTSSPDFDLSQSHFQKTTNRFLQVNTRLYYQAKKN